MNQPLASIGARPEPQSPASPLWGALLCALLLLPLAGPWELRPLAALAPLPLMVQRLRGGSGAVALGAVLALATLGFVAPGLQTPLAALALLLPGLLMADAIARGRGLMQGCGWALAAATAAVVVGLLVRGGVAMEATLQELLRLTPGALTQLRAQTGGEFDDWLEHAEAWRQALSVVYPAAWFVVGGLVVVLNAVLLRAWLLRTDPGWLEPGEFERVRLPIVLTLPFVGAGALLAFESSRRAGLNALVVLAFFFALQGLAIVAYYLQRLAGPALLRAGLAALLLLNPWATHFLVALGLFDNWADFRKYADPPPDEDA